MLERAFGIETEYGLSAIAFGMRWDISTIFPNGWKNFRPNGSRMYMDIGRHPEYATAEVRRPEDLIAQVYAGHLEIERLGHELVAHQPDDNRSDLAIYANNVAQVSRTRTLDGALLRSWDKIASHESYQTRRLLGAEEMIAYARPLFSYWATRIILFGTGKWYFGGDRFEISQRASFCDAETGASTTTGMQIFNLRQEPHSSSYSRIHLTTGETNIRPDLLGLRAAMMLALLAMLDAGRLTGLDMPRTDLVMKYGSICPQAKFPVHERSEMTPLEVQLYYFDQAYEFVRDESGLSYLRPWMDKYGFLLELLRAGYDAEGLTRHLDWAAKKVVLEQYERRNPGVSRNRLEGVELEMHRLGSPLMLGIMRRGGYDDYLPAIERARTEPPADTRAAVRARAAAAGFEIDWARFTVPERLRRHLSEQRRHVVCVDDPLDSEGPELLRSLIETLDRH